MGNTQTNEKQSKTGKSPAKGKHFIRNLNRKGSLRESKKHSKKKSNAKLLAVDREYDKTPDSDNNETIEASDNDTAECVFKTSSRVAGGAETTSVQSEVTVSRCEAHAERRSPTRNHSPVAPIDSNSESVFTEPLTPLAVELNQCYYSAESDSVHDEPTRTLLTPTRPNAFAQRPQTSDGDISPLINMSHDDAISLTHDAEKEIKSDIFDDSVKTIDNEKAMGTLLSKIKHEHYESNDCDHDFFENRLKACPGQTSFTLSKHRKIDLSPVTTCEKSLSAIDNDKDRRHSSLSDASIGDSNVLRKVASLTLDKLQTESKISRPKFIPEKLDFQLYQKFEGQMLLNWFISSIAENSHLKNLISIQDLKNIGIQYCTHLLAAGVLRQICDKDAPTENVFKPSLMYYWAHMEVPAVQPLTPGRLQMCTWPPEKEMNQQVAQDKTATQRNIETNQYHGKNNNVEVNDINEAKVVIKQLMCKIKELEQEKNQINAYIEVMNKNLQNNIISIQDNNFIRDRVELLSKEIQTSEIQYEKNKLPNRPVIMTPKYDSPIRTNIVHDKTIELSRLTFKNEHMKKESEGKAEIRSDKIENYCKLNKSRDCNKPFQNDELLENIDNNNIFTEVEHTQSLPNSNHIISQLHKVNDFEATSLTQTNKSSSDTSFTNIYTSNDLLKNEAEIVLDVRNNEVIVGDVTIFTPTNILFSKVETKVCTSSETSQSSSSEQQLMQIQENEITFKGDNVNVSNNMPDVHKTETYDLTLDKTQVVSMIKDSSEVIINPSQVISSLPPPLPGKTPPPPPAPGTPLLMPELITSVPHTATSLISSVSLVTITSSPAQIDLNSSTETKSSFQSDSSSTSKIYHSPHPLLLETNGVVILNDDKEKISSSKSTVDLLPPHMLPELKSLPVLEHILEPPCALESDIGQTLHPFPTQMSDIVTPSPPEANTIAPSLPEDNMVAPSLPEVNMVALSPPEANMIPLPLMPGTGPPSAPRFGMGLPPPTMSEMSPPLPMPGMGPPPSPMPGLGPPPPPMPGMGPPPPPMPGMGPPPPPMPGMGPPPPPMPGMGPPPPPMPGMIPPPIVMPGVNTPLSAPSLNEQSSSDTTQARGPVPFPAPPIGGWNHYRATLRKIPVKPAAPMKPLYWTRILASTAPPVAQGDTSSTGFKPLWLEIDETKLDNIDEFTDLFSRQVVKAPLKKKVEVKEKLKPVKLLNSKRSQNVGILAQSLHLEFSEIENAIYNFDTSVVSLEALQQIYDVRANNEELMAIKDHLREKPDIPLDKPEAFLNDLSSIPNFAERISCFMFQAEFEDAVNTMMHKLDNLKHTCEFLVTNEPLKQLFAIILTLGNYMNGGNCQRGQADGFGLEILAKLKDVKSKQSHITLLHFIVRTYMRARGGPLSDGCTLPVPEPGDVVRAASLDFSEVADGLTALHKRLEACREETKKVLECDEQRNAGDEASSGDSTKKLDVFREKMTTFLEAAEEKLKTENENLEECRAKFISTVKFYQYTPKCGKMEDCEPKEFFLLWTSFCSDFKDIFKKEEQIAFKERLKENKKLQEERKSLTQPKKEGGLKARLQKLSSTRK